MGIAPDLSEDDFSESGCLTSPPMQYRDSTRKFDLNLRVGIHFSECEIRGESFEGVAVHIAA